MKHTGSCHCGKVKYEVEVAIDSALSCNCSICEKRGSLLGFAPESAFKLLDGKADLAEYLFNTHKIRHQFCKTCGILPFAFAQAPDGTPTVALNLRTIDGIDLKALKINEYDGRSR